MRRSLLFSVIVGNTGIDVIAVMFRDHFPFFPAKNQYGSGFRIKGLPGALSFKITPPLL